MHCKTKPIKSQEQDLKKVASLIFDMNIGGQALIEGVLMRSPHHVAVAVRSPNGKIVTKAYRKEHPAITYKHLPIIRGFLALIDMLAIGMKELFWSSEISSGEKMSRQESGWSLALSIAFALALFVALPFYVSKLVTEQYWLFNLLEGMLRVIIFLGYILVIAQFKDIQRVFQYHGAEHASIACHESSKKLTPENVKKFSTIHPRCGTAFIFIVLILSIIVFSFAYHPSWLMRFFGRIMLIPVIAGLSYELLKLNAKYHLPVLSWFSIPGLWLQKITTRRPDKSQIEVTIAALKLALARERTK